MASKPGYRFGPGSSAGQVLFGTGMASGLKAARAWIRLRHGTLEPVVLDSKGKGASGEPARLRVPKLEGPSLHNRGTGTERPAVVMIGRNGPGRQVGALVKAWPCGAKGSCHRVLVQRVNHG
jgi:hypothetical protein